MLTGSVRDRETSSHVTNAKVECINVSDSIVGTAYAISYDYDLSRQMSAVKAEFCLEIPRHPDIYTLRLTHEDYDTLYAPLDLTRMGIREYDRDLGVFYMDRVRINRLKDLEVRASKVMFYNRGDTVVYNADAFQLADGSMLDVLIEQLPGVELREGGQIYVNGKFVQSLLLNGKDFFKGNNRIMLDNLSAYTIKNVEVYKRQTDRARFLGLEGENAKELVMDVKLKKEYIGGWNINLEGASGSEDRYMGRLFAMHFNALSQFTVLGNANNLSDQTRPTSEDAWDPENMSDGEIRHQEMAVDYSTENAQGSLRATGSLTVSRESNYTDRETSSIDFIPSHSTYSMASDASTGREVRLDTRHRFYAQSSNLALSLSPYFTWEHGKRDSRQNSASFRDTDSMGLINSTLCDASGRNDNIRAGVSANSTLKIANTSDAIDVFAGIKYSGVDQESESFSIIKYGNPAIIPDCRRQATDSKPTYTVNYNAGVQYNLRLSDKLNCNMSYKMLSEHAANTSSFYLGRLINGQYDDCTLDNLHYISADFDPANSNTSTEISHAHLLTANATWMPCKYWELSAELPLHIVSKSLVYNQDDKDYSSYYRGIMFDGVSVSLGYSKQGDGHGYTNLNIDFSHNYQLPMLSNMIDIPNTRNPLVRYRGNPDLKPTVDDSYSVMLQKSTGSLSAYVYSMLTTSKDAQANGYTFDQSTGSRTYMTYNVAGDWRLYNTAYIYWHCDKYRWSASLQCSYTHGQTHSMLGTDGINPRLITLISNSFTPTLKIDKAFGQGKSLSVSVAPAFRHNKSSDPSCGDINPRTGRYSVKGIYALPYGWSVSTSLCLTCRSGYNDPKMDRSRWMWNARISKTINHGNLLVSVVAYDLLRQNTSYDCYVTPVMKIEYNTNTIPRYILLDIQYKINTKPK